MRLLLFLLISCFIACKGDGQIDINHPVATDKAVGGGCDGCEQLYQYDPRTISNIDTLPEFLSQKEKIKVSGTIYQLDGKTPAANVIMYLYHTDENGLYDTRGTNENRYINHRGWVKTNADGRYTFYTFKPAAYPSNEYPCHIHPTIKEAGKTVYYIDDFNFADDPLLTREKREKLPLRGGSGIMEMRWEDDLWVGKRDIILGLNIPNY